MTVNRNDRVLSLSRALCPAVSPESVTQSTIRSERVASVIVDDPQAHIDALVEAGVLRASSTDRPECAFYEVIFPKPPHEHDWLVYSANPTSVRIHCKGCRDALIVGNHLPIANPSP